METTVATKEECARLLRSLNIAFSVSENGGFRCRAEEITGKPRVRKYIK